ncbi:MAG: DUF2092 domain-containing protein [Sphingomicrobium sp.]
MSRLTLIIALIPLGLSAAPAIAQDARSPEALAALDRMGAALRSHQAVNVHSEVTVEDVLTSGQKLQYGGTVDIVARRPSQIRMSQKLGTNERVLYFDGQNLTVASPGLGYYATAQSPGTIKDMLTIAQDRYGLEVPLADLFAWGSDPAMTAKLTSAMDAGEEMIGGQMCDHYAMRQQGLDWQVWIRQGQDALPCKLVLTKLSDPAMPQFSAVYSWSDQPPPEGDAYTYTPPPGAKPIGLGELRPPSIGGK